MSKDEGTSSAASSTGSSSGGAVGSTSPSRGIPAAAFIEDVSNHLSSHKSTADQLVNQLNSLYSKYKFMESQLLAQHRHVASKVPDIENALTAVKFLIEKQKSASKESLSVNYELSDGIYAGAKVVPKDQVCLWLGASVMVEYSYADAEQLLTKNLNNAKINIGSLDVDLAFLKEQITTTEVNIARVHNHRVALKQAAQAAAAKDGSVTTTSTAPGISAAAAAGAVAVSGAQSTLASSGVAATPI